MPISKPKRILSRFIKHNQPTKKTTPSNEAKKTFHDLHKKTSKPNFLEKAKKNYAEKEAMKRALAPSKAPLNTLVPYQAASKTLVPYNAIIECPIIYSDPGKSEKENAIRFMKTLFEACERGDYIRFDNVLILIDNCKTDKNISLQQEIWREGKITINKGRKEVERSFVEDQMLGPKVDVVYKHPDNNVIIKIMYDKKRALFIPNLEKHVQGINCFSPFISVITNIIMAIEAGTLQPIFNTGKYIHIIAKDDANLYMAQEDPGRTESEGLLFSKNKYGFHKSKLIMENTFKNFSQRELLNICYEAKYRKS